MTTREYVDVVEVVGNGDTSGIDTDPVDDCEEIDIDGPDLGDRQVG